MLSDTHMPYPFASFSLLAQDMEVSRGLSSFLPLQWTLGEACPKAGTDLRVPTQTLSGANAI